MHWTAGFRLVSNSHVIGPPPVMRVVRPHNMIAPRTPTLLIAGVVLVLFGFGLMRPVLKHKAVVTPGGDVTRALDRFGTFMLNWDAHLFQSLGCGCLAWGAGRIAVRLIKGCRAGEA